MDEIRTKTINSKDYKSGVYTLRDVRHDPSWGDVVAVEDHRRHDGSLIGVINHRDYDQAVARFTEST